MYVLDEPSIGLHQRDNLRLIATLRRLRDLGNSVIVVEHDAETIESADHVVDFGPGQDARAACGRRRHAQGNRGEQSLAHRTLFGGNRSHRSSRHSAKTHGLSHRARGARAQPQEPRCGVPLGVLLAVTGVSGAGKSSLINGILHPALRRKLYGGFEPIGLYSKLEGIDQIDKVVDIDQKPIGRTPRSNPATYTKAFDHIRELYAETAEAKTFGFGPAVFRSTSGRSLRSVRG